MTWGVPLLVSYHFAFHTVHGFLKARILKWLVIPFSSGPCSVRPLHHDPPVLGCPAGMAWFRWVRQGCGPSVIRLTSFLWLWFQCVCPLMLSYNTYRLPWVSLTLDMGYLFMAAPAKHSCCSLPQYASKFGKLSSGHRTGKGQFSFQSQRKAMPKHAQTTAKLHSSHTLVK